MSRFTGFTDEYWMALERHLMSRGLAVDKDAHNPETDRVVPGIMTSYLREQSAPKLVHGLFTSLAEKVATVKGWPGVDPEAVDAALLLAQEDGTVAGYMKDVRKNVLLDIVITIYCESIPNTLLYARERMRETWAERYREWEACYMQGVDDDRVKAIPGAKPFVPNRVVIEVVDFGANWDRQGGITLQKFQSAQASRLADFAVLFNASQSPMWVERMDGVHVPFAVAAPLLLNVPKSDPWRVSPNVWYDGLKGCLGGDHVEDPLPRYAKPVLLRYAR